MAHNAASALGLMVRERRAALGMSLTLLAERVGCAKSYLSAIENGRRGPPGDELLRRLERALGLTSGELERVARWQRTPEPVRRDFANLHEGQRAVDALTSLVGRDGLDAAYRSGELGRVIEQLRPAEERPLEAALPNEVPVINSVTAGYPHDFTDMGYPARVADEYVRCPDLHDPDAFAARVVGDSMEPDYRQGDIVVFSPIRDAASGTDCFVRLEPDHESTFKRVYFETGEDGAELIRIQPINNRYPPRVVPREQVAGLYRAVSLQRSVP
ncbi:MAG: hypothetical protein DHS20C14_14420 [Phycisphaeraceae bacterium]|nr:MAG: hypothetical protein DHS20C14_14420 [Phycisphaeraceae bacterium]